MRLNKWLLMGTLLFSLGACSSVGELSVIKDTKMINSDFEQYKEKKKIDFKGKKKRVIHLDDGTLVEQKLITYMNTPEREIRELIRSNTKYPFARLYKYYYIDTKTIKSSNFSLKGVLLESRKFFDKNGKLIKEDFPKKKSTSYKSILKLLDKLDYIDLKTITINKDFFPDFHLGFYENKGEAFLKGLNSKEKEEFFQQENVQKYYTKSTKFWVATFERIDRVEKAIHTIFIDDRTGELIDIHYRKKLPQAYE
jgi:hypothetical protein